MSSTPRIAITMVHLVPEDLDGNVMGMLWECYGNVMDPPNDQEAGQILSIEDLSHLG